ncbi:hypothetical protein QVD99_003362 [Batrachochytrium dendrobatidis]|nr:hypothetical protein O5D80_008644 [Batrachochytrium dendrobatidis]KAK5670175.1 hypothetical protein QVD99_003362 [Batrachochytrium dendrobatidis]
MFRLPSRVLSNSSKCEIEGTLNMSLPTGRMVSRGRPPTRPWTGRPLSPNRFGLPPKNRFRKLTSYRDPIDLDLRDLNHRQSHRSTQDLEYSDYRPKGN